MREPGARTVEIERSFDVDADTAIPDWTALPGVVRVGVAQVRHLDALYLDTDDLALGRHGYALRRRTGGNDAGWHVKGPRSGLGREELHWPLGTGMRAPAEVLAAVSRVTEEPLSPLARIRNTRTAFALNDHAGQIVAEFADDLVRTRDERSGVGRSWREWELELGPAAPTTEAGRTALFAAAERLIRAQGGRPAGSPSKLARALGG